jgi:hypothetical protein
VAGQAWHIKVLSQQWVVGFGVIEGGNEGRFSPCGRAMAGFTSLRELAFMRIGVARNAS